MKKQFFQFAAGLGIFAIALFLMLLFPALSVLYIPLCLGVFCALNAEGGKWKSILLLIIAFSGTLFFSKSIILAALCSVLPFVFSLVSANFFKNDLPEKNLTVIFGIANAIFFVLIFYFAKNELNGFEGLIAQMTDNFNQNLNLFVQQGLIDIEFKESYIAQLQITLEYLKRMAPSILFVFFAVSGYITIWAVWLISKLLKSDDILKPAFSRFKCNTVTTGLTILVCILSIFIKDGVLGVALDNIFNIFTFLLCVCTASLADCWLKGKNWVLIVRIIIVIFLLSNYSGSFISLIMSMIAIIDARADFRRLEH